jgi:hypothetical protein
MNKREYLYQRKNRCVGSILGELERYFTDEQMKEIRSIVKTRINEYHLDVIDTIDDSSEAVFNALAAKARDRIAG